MSVDVTGVPIWSSVPLVLVGTETVPLLGGEYNFSGRPLQMSPREELVDNALYISNHISFGLNISELDFQSALVDAPKINFFSTGEGRTPLVRKPITAPIYYQKFDYHYAFQMKKSPSEILFSIRGRITQTANLIGVQNIIANVIIELYEVVDDVFISKFKAMGKQGAISGESIFKQGEIKARTSGGGFSGQ